LKKQKEELSMTVVFKPQQVYSGRIPNLESFELIMKRIKQEATANCFIGILVYGSYSHRLELTSDLDLLVIYEPQHEVKALMHIEAWKRVAQSRFVSLNTIHAPVGSMIPQIDDGIFWEHLASCADRGFALHRNPLPFIAKTQTNIHEHTMAHTQWKLNALCQLMTKTSRPQKGNQPLYMDLASEVLKRPIHIARRAVRVRQGFFTNDSKSSVQQRYLACFPELANQFTELLALNNRYSEIIRRRKEFALIHPYMDWDMASLREYIDLLKEINASSQKLKVFMEDNLMALSKPPTRIAY
jgi:predicted nucleotidyltransferase